MVAVPEEHMSSNHFIESELDRKLRLIGEHVGGDVITVVAPMHAPIDDLIRDHIEDINEKKENLLVILETNGGSIEVVERIADLLRYHYQSPKEVSFLVPNSAMSAGTVLVMSGDKIYMDYYSVLGPIDPQVKSRSKGDVWVPALGYLSKYDAFVKKSGQGKLTALEIAFFVQKFDPAELHQFEQARDLSIDLLKKWLVKYKFKNWITTHTKKKAVTPKMREDRAAEIATKLNNTSMWKSHGRGLSREVITRDLNLVIEDFGADAELNLRVRSYYRLLQDYMIRVGNKVVIHTPEHYLGV